MPPKSPEALPRIVYLNPSLVPPPQDPQYDRFFLMSGLLQGDVVQPVWFQTPAEVEEFFGPGSYPYLTRGSFRHHFLLVGKGQGLATRLRIFRFFIEKTRQLHRQNPFQCVVAYSHLTTGLIGVLLKWILGCPLTIELGMTPDNLYVTHNAKVTLKDRLRKLYSDLSLHITVLSSGCLHLYHPGQLRSYPLLRKTPGEYFHCFVATSQLHRHPPAEEDYILQIGAPWFLKGSDLVIEAFRRIQPKYPNLKLIIQGHFPDLDQHMPPGGFGPNIEIRKAEPNHVVLPRIGKAKVLVLASRTEGMPRILLEGMASGVPVIGSDVGGIPSLIHDGECGFVFPSGDIDALADRLDRLLSDEPLRLRMAARAYEIAHSERTELAYAQGFRAMVDKAIQG